MQYQAAAPVNSATHSSHVAYRLHGMPMQGKMPVCWLQALQILLFCPYSHPICFSMASFSGGVVVLGWEPCADLRNCAEDFTKDLSAA